MKHEMPVMTEEKRQALIADCKEFIANPECYQDWFVIMAKISLASLEAEPEYNTSYAEDINLDVSKAAYDLCHPDDRWISYPAPPVPVIPKKLRSDDFSPKGWIVSHDYRQGFNEAIEEIERLNKVKE